MYPFAGQARSYNISKHEDILEGASIIYGSASEIIPTIEYELTREKQFNYTGLTSNESISHYAQFIASLWQIHPFGEGNTRTCAVFLFKYLRKRKHDLSLNTFAGYSKYFRGALVRANYSDRSRGINETTQYLELFLNNLVVDEKNVLDTQDLYISQKIEYVQKNLPRVARTGSQI